MARVLAAGVAGNVFPGAAACIAWRSGASDPVLAVAVAGRLSAKGAKVTPGTFYDLASLTKPVVAMAAARMMAQRVISPRTTAGSCVGDLRGTPGAAATLEELLTHRSGLAAWGGLYLDAPHELGSGATRRWMLCEASRRAKRPPPPAPVYSDLGYLIAGEMLARSVRSSLDKIVSEQVSEPLGLSRQLFYPHALSRSERGRMVRPVAPTERCVWRGRVLEGEVHDENCFAFGGVAGHAGLFGTATAVANFGLAVLDARAGGGTLLSREALEWILQERPGGAYRLGWDSPSRASEMVGRQMSPSSFGHWGFTGTSLWCDPERHAAIVLLTNRVHPTRANVKIRAFRPAFHDGALRALDRLQRSAA